MPTRYIFLLCFFVLCAHPCKGADALAINNRFEAGKTYEYEQVSQISTVPEGTAFAETPDSHITVHYVAQATREQGTDNLALQVLVSSVKAGVMQEGLIYAYDSSDPAKSPPPLQQLFGGVKDKTFTLIYSPSLDLIEIRAPNDDATLLKGMPVMTSRQLAESFHLLQMASLPKRTVEKGAEWEWKCKLQLPPMPTIIYNGKSRLDGRQSSGQPDQVAVAVEGTLESHDKDTPAPATATAIPLLTDAIFKGSQIFDTKQRLLIQTTVSCEFNLFVNGGAMRTLQYDSCRLLSVKDKTLKSADD